jgi:hypothetical protein
MHWDDAGHDDYVRYDSDGQRARHLNLIFDSGEDGPITSFSISDGLVDLTDMNSGALIEMKTDALGNITDWFIEDESATEFAQSEKGFDFSAITGTNGVTLGEGQSLSSGTWSPYTAAVPTPEPSSLLMLGMGFAGLLGVACYRQRHATADAAAA